MFGYFIRRVSLLIPTFLGITIVAFGFVRILPGDPVLLMAGERGLTPERYEKLLNEFGYNRPIWEQYFDYLWKLLHGDMGYSLVTKQPVFSEFFTLFPATVELAICAILLAILLGLPAGIISASKRGSFSDQAIMGTALVGYSMPIFWWGLLLIIVFSGWLGWTPVSGRISLMYYFEQNTGFMLIDSLISNQQGAFGSAVKHLILPTVVLATIPLAVIARQNKICHARNIRRRLCAHCSRKGIVSVESDLYSRIAQCNDPSCDSNWPQCWDTTCRRYID